LRSKAPKKGTFFWLRLDNRRSIVIMLS